MEEILASIRRIISEDGAPQQDSEMATTGSASAAAVPEDRSPAAAGEADDALLLTEMVNEDGSVVSLAGKPAAEPAPIEPASEPPLPEPPAAPPRPAPAAAPVAPEPAPPSPMEETAQEPELGVLEEEPESQPESEPTMPEPDLPEEPRREAPSTTQELSASVERLVSEETFAASTAALSQLSRTMRKDKDVQIGGGRMVEDLVREALEPMLKAWLDANLQEIVERLVRQEIERMVRRAEED